MKVTQDIIDYYKANGKPKERLGELIERIGFTEFSKGVLK